VATRGATKAAAAGDVHDTGTAVCVPARADDGGDIFAQAHGAIGALVCIGSVVAGLVGDTWLRDGAGARSGHLMLRNAWGQKLGG